MKLADHVDLKHNCGFVTMVWLGSNDGLGNKDKLANVKTSEEPTEYHCGGHQSPVNGITDQECADILREEVDSLKKVRKNVIC